MSFSFLDVIKLIKMVHKISNGREEFREGYVLTQLQMVCYDYSFMGVFFKTKTGIKIACSIITFASLFQFLLQVVKQTMPFTVIAFICHQICSKINEASPANVYLRPRSNCRFSLLI